MPFLLLDSLQHYPTASRTAKWPESGGSPTIEIDAGFGSVMPRGLRCTGSGPQWVGRALTPAPTTCSVGVYVRLDDYPDEAVPLMSLMAEGVALFDLRVQSDGALCLTDVAGDLLARLDGEGAVIWEALSSGVLPTDTHVCVEWMMSLDPLVTPGVVSVDGEPWNRLPPGLSAWPEGTEAIDAVRLGNRTAAVAPTCDYTGVYLADSPMRFGTFQIHHSLPSADDVGFGGDYVDGMSYGQSYLGSPGSVNSWIDDVLLDGDGSALTEAITVPSPIRGPFWAVVMGTPLGLTSERLIRAVQCSTMSRRMSGSPIAVQPAGRLIDHADYSVVDVAEGAWIEVESTDYQTIPALFERIPSSGAPWTLDTLLSFSWGWRLRCPADVVGSGSGQIATSQLVLEVLSYELGPGLRLTQLPLEGLTGLPTVQVTQMVQEQVYGLTRAGLTQLVAEIASAPPALRVTQLVREVVHEPVPDEGGAIPLPQGSGAGTSALVFVVS